MARTPFRHSSSHCNPRRSSGNSSSSHFVPLFPDSRVFGEDSPMAFSIDPFGEEFLRASVENHPLVTHMEEVPYSDALYRFEQELRVLVLTASQLGYALLSVISPLLRPLSRKEPIVESSRRPEKMPVEEEGGERPRVRKRAQVSAYVSINDLLFAPLAQRIFSAERHKKSRKDSE
ncbi:uncharacterized protein G2W53_032903 [Senna tora]|uniref:Uncharacterized protein n=1 Tax=Senna tora TaxID=362788 RepID=A0A834W7C7_9FABA|nr:uncharacterized protein G2W53_032903 [Senna tora]